MLKNIHINDKFIVKGRDREVVITIKRKVDANQFEVETHNGKLSVISRDTINTFERYIEPKHKKKTLLDWAVEVLLTENKPMKVSEILSRILAGGYKAPRSGTTLECTLSARLTTNAKECIVSRVKVKKLATGIFVHKDWNGEFTVPLTVAEQKELDRKKKQSIIQNETDLLLK